MKQQVPLVFLALSQWLSFPAVASTSAVLSANGDLDEGALQDGEGSSKQQEGSWSHWWSYDGISGPDYWNINKRWRLCSLGRKQSPIEVLTDRLVYDHLLGPLRLSWLPGGATNLDEPEEERKVSRSKDDEQHRPVKVQLLNSGRGLEVWLEAGLGGLKRPAPELGQQDQLILSRGPLSYSYKLFKIELHSAAPALEMQLRPTTTMSSEHLIDGRSFDGELQLHFYNKHLALSAAEAQQLANEDSRPNLFAAVSVFLLATHQHESGASLRGHLKVQKRNVTDSAIDFILNNLSALQNETDSVKLDLSRHHIESLLTSRRHYVTYQGSMNRPPCAESVDWILLNKAMRVDADKLQALFERLNTNQENIRPVKPLNRRLLRTTINIQAGAHSEEDPNDEIEHEMKRQRAQPDCSSAAGPLAKDCNNTGDSLPDKQSRAKSGGSCSMRPNYAYQLTGVHNTKLPT